jgi:hypothetical protein
MRADDPQARVVLRLSNDLRLAFASSLSPYRQKMKLVVATFSLLVLLALSGLLIALVGGRSGFLAQEFSRQEFSAEVKLVPAGWVKARVKALRCWSEIEAPADCPQW